VSEEGPTTGANPSELSQFKRLLDEQNDWPAYFTFKFIVPRTQIDALEKILAGYELKRRPSRKGNYLAVTLTPLMQSSDEVLRIYGETSVIEGIVSL